MAEKKFKAVAAPVIRELPEFEGKNAVQQKFISVNGVGILMQTGVPVYVSPEYAEAIDNSRLQQRASKKYEESLPKAATPTSF